MRPMNEFCIASHRMPNNQARRALKDVNMLKGIALGPMNGANNTLMNNIKLE